MNNTEGVFLDKILTGEITITVTGANIAGDGVPGYGDDTDQDFALSIYLLQEEPPLKYIFPIFYR